MMAIFLLFYRQMIPPNLTVAASGTSVLTSTECLLAIDKNAMALLFHLG